MKKVIITLFVLLSGLIIAPKSQARDNITDWYIQDFRSEIVVNKDSSLDITENITADCGNLPDKHGIFRVLPTHMWISDNESVKTPISLTSITDFNGTPIKYSTSRDTMDGTVTWKIGDPNKTVTGVNYYRIKYHVKNAVRHNSSDFDELYWNLNGNFWDIETDNFKATVTFPDQITLDSPKINIYSGAFGETNSLKPDYTFDNNKLTVSYAKTLSPGQGITASVTFPKGIVAPYVPTFLEKYGSYFYLLIPILILWLCIILWRKYGRDPKINPTIAPEFEIPEDLAPIEMGLVYSDGILKHQYLSASIINLAVNKLIKIEKTVEGKVFKSTDYVLTKLDSKYQPLAGEKSLLDTLFGSGNEVKMSDLKNKFYKNLPDITEASKNYLIGKKWLIASSRTWQYTFIFFAIAFGVLAGVASSFDIYLMLALIISAVIIVIFSFLMTRRSQEGAKLNQRIKGFKLYMDTAEKYRQRFNEKENYLPAGRQVFEKFLPYAIMFGMTKEWIKKMKDIYGEKYFAGYHPVWFYGAAFSNFNVDSFSSELDSMTSSMASTISSSPSPSGSGGGGFSGGGGGGGGGGGW